MRGCFPRARKNLPRVPANTSRPGRSSRALSIACGPARRTPLPIRLPARTVWIRQTLQVDLSLPTALGTGFWLVSQGTVAKPKTRPINALGGDDGTLLTTSLTDREFG